ncbi:MAG: 3-hydroxyacyl-CoA dehydrogenase NAD-binding domain-containing protein [Bacteroidota bacterium]
MTIGVIGAGTMGSGIAQVAATADCQVLLYDRDAIAVKKSRLQLEKIMTRLVAKDRIDAAEKRRIEGNISYVATLPELSPCELVIEAIIEDLDIKKQVFAELEEYLTDTAILATNTSSLSVASIASALTKPERCIGIHFFNPAPLMKLVELIPAIQTAPAVVTQTTEIIRSWSKTIALAKDTPGFIVNRVARPFYGEALRIYEEGMADVATIDWAMKTIGGFRMGPFELMDFIGNDVNYVVTETVFEAFYYDPRYRPSFTQKRLSEAGYLGRKSGRGYYDYRDGAERPQPTEDHDLGNQIFERILVMLINEAADAYFLNIASVADIDTAMTKGVNYPKGLLQWADEKGINWCVQQLDALYDEYHEDRYRCSPLLRKMQREGGRFWLPPTPKEAA